MTLDSIKAHFFPGRNAFHTMSDSHKCALIIKACSWIQHTARSEAAEHYHCDEKEIIQVLIRSYLCDDKEYDAIEISKIVKTFMEELNNG